MAMARQDMMQAQQLVVDESFEQIENPPTHNEGSGKRISMPGFRLTSRGVKQQCDSRGGSHQHCEMEPSVLNGLPLQLTD